MKIDSNNMAIRMRRMLVVTALAAAAAGAASDAVAAFDTFLKLDGVPGESADDKHKGEIDVLAWSWGANGLLPGTKKTRQPFCAQDLSVTKYVDAATPKLIAKAVIGEVIPTARLTVRKLGKGAQEFLLLDMTGVRVSAEATGHTGDDARLTESVKLKFETLTVTYRPQQPDGSLGQGIVANVAGGCPK